MTKIAKKSRITSICYVLIHILSNHFLSCKTYDKIYFDFKIKDTKYSSYIERQ